MLLISAFKRRFGWIFVYTLSDKFALTGKLIITYLRYIQFSIDKRVAHAYDKSRENDFLLDKYMVKTTN